VTGPRRPLVTGPRRPLVTGPRRLSARSGDAPT
jgi:hypothetical protein